MPRRKLRDKNTRKLTRHGGSISVSIPKEFLTALKWREKQKVVLKKRGKKITIEDWPARRPVRRSSEERRRKRSKGGKK